MTRILRGVGIFLNEKWMGKFANIGIVSDRMIFIKVLVQGIIVSFITVNALYFVQYWWQVWGKGSYFCRRKL